MNNHITPAMHIAKAMDNINDANFTANGIIDTLEKLERYISNYKATTKHLPTTSQNINTQVSILYHYLGDLIDYVDSLDWNIHYAKINK